MTDERRPLRWLLFKQESEQYPYRLLIEERPGEFLSLSVQERWPGAGRKICCRLDGKAEAVTVPDEEPVEASSIASINRYKMKLTVILDRKTRKRCWFIFLKKEYKLRPGEFYDQIFWITQSAAKIKRPGAYIPRVRDGSWVEIVVDQREHYPYKFGYARTRRAVLPVGDYALIKEGKITAVVERKTLDNFLHEIATYDALKATLQELSGFPYKAVVFESPYSDFLNPGKIKPYRAPYVAGYS